MKRLLLPLLLSLAIPAYARVDPEIHEMCLKAQDYKGCLEANKKKSSKKTRGYRKTLKECLAFVSKKPKFLEGLSPLETNQACEDIANIDYKKTDKIFKDRVVFLKPSDNKEGKLSHVFQDLFFLSSYYHPKMGFYEKYHINMCGAETLYLMKSIDE